MVVFILLEGDKPQEITLGRFERKMCFTFGEGLGAQNAAFGEGLEGPQGP